MRLARQDDCLRFGYEVVTTSCGLKRLEQAIKDAQRDRHLASGVEHLQLRRGVRLICAVVFMVEVGEAQVLPTGPECALRSGLHMHHVFVTGSKASCEMRPSDQVTRPVQPMLIDGLTGGCGG